MSSKKKKKDPAQQLIDSLLDERTPTPSAERDVSEAISLQGKQISEQVQLDETPHFMRANAQKQDQAKSEPHFSDATATAAVFNSSDVKSVRLELENTPGAEDKTEHVAAKKPRPINPDATIPQRSVPPRAREREPQTESQDKSKPERSAIDRAGITELKTVVKMRDRFGAAPGGYSSASPKSSTAQGGGVGPAFTSPEAALKQSENLRIAQSRITELEHELERIRRENEQLGTAGETLRRRSDELLSKVENYDLQQKELERIHTEEKKVYRGQLQSKDRENADMRGRLEEMENRLESNFKKIRVRERELEHRLEIVRMESQTLVSTKDKMILELKRHVDQITLEGDYAKQKSQEMFNQYKDKQETIRRVVRALRIALTILEGDEDAAGLKKAD